MSAKRTVALGAIALVGVFAGAQLNTRARPRAVRANGLSLTAVSFILEAPGSAAHGGAPPHMSASDRGVAALVRRLEHAVPRFQSAYARISAALGIALSPPAKPKAMIAALTLLSNDVSALRHDLKRTRVTTPRSRQARRLALITLTLSQRGIGIYLQALKSPYAPSFASRSAHGTAILEQSKTPASETMTLVGCHNPCYHVL